MRTSEKEKPGCQNSSKKASEKVMEDDQQKTWGADIAQASGRSPLTWLAHGGSKVRCGLFLIHLSLKQW